MSAARSSPDGQASPKGPPNGTGNPLQPSLHASCRAPCPARPRGRVPSYQAAAHGPAGGACSSQAAHDEMTSVDLASRLRLGMIFRMIDLVDDIHRVGFWERGV